jgi:multiple sugar transport system permease protein
MYNLNLLIRRVRRVHKKKLFATVLIAPSFALTMVLVIYPFFFGIWSSFHGKNLLRPENPFVGLQNFIYLFHDTEYWRDLWQTIIWTAGSVFMQHLVALPIALLLNKGLKLRFLFRGIFLIPWVCPVVVFALLWQWLYSDLYGIINYTLISLKIIDSPVIWLGTKSIAMISCIIANTWRGFSFPMIAILAQLQMIPEELYEACEIDGGSKWQEFIYITLPFLKAPITITTIILSIWTFNNFGTMYLLTRGGPGKATETLPILAYLTSFYELKVGRASAITVTMIFMLFILTFLYLRKSKSLEE